jgi:glycosyltransferase involved in cell wall biosynthesis
MENNPKKLSFIVPFYNVEKYIAECIDSLYEQNIPEDEYEVICVNNCSPDHTKEIVLQYQKLHPNLILLEHKINQGLGVARNTGLKEAKGEYVWFIDSDDFILKNCLKNLLLLIINNGLDILNFDLFRYNADHSAIPQSISPETKIICGAEWLKNLKNNFDENSSICRKIFNRKFLQKNDVRFPNRLYEDEYISMFTVYKATRFMHLDKCIYFYRCTPNSILSQRLTDYHYISILEVGAEYINFYNQIKTSDPTFAFKVKMSGFWKINFGCKHLVYYTSPLRKKMMDVVNPHLKLIQKSYYFKGFTQKYFKYFRLSNWIFMWISPLFRLSKRIKRLLKSKFIRTK